MDEVETKLAVRKGILSQLDSWAVECCLKEFFLIFTPYFLLLQELQTKAIVCMSTPKLHQKQNSLQGFFNRFLIELYDHFHRPASSVRSSLSSHYRFPIEIYCFISTNFLFTFSSKSPSCSCLSMNNFIFRSNPGAFEVFFDILFWSVCRISFF